MSQGFAQLYRALKKAGASAELHVYAGAGHVFGLRESCCGPVAWVARFREWLDARNLTKKVKSLGGVYLP